MLAGGTTAYNTSHLPYYRLAGSFVAVAEEEELPCALAGEMDTGAVGMIPSSPSTETSSSSSDIDTESTWSFFRDRSTTLGTLMGVSLVDEDQELPQATIMEVSGRPSAPAPEEGDGCSWRRRWNRRRRRRGASWWRLCRDDGFGGATSLDQFLDMERRRHPGEDGGEATAPLFENGRVLPSSSTTAVAEENGKLKLRRSAAQGTLSLAVLLIGICTGAGA